MDGVHAISSSYTGTPRAASLGSFYTVTLHTVDGQELTLWHGGCNNTPRRVNTYAHLDFDRTAASAHRLLAVGHPAATGSECSDARGIRAGIGRTGERACARG